MSDYAPTFVKLIQSGGCSEDMVAHMDRTRDNRILESHTFSSRMSRGNSGA